MDEREYGDMEVQRGFGGTKQKRRWTGRLVEM